MCQNPHQLYVCETSAFFLKINKYKKKHLTQKCSECMVLRSDKYLNIVAHKFCVNLSHRQIV
jgi:hypothetical protein